MAPSLISTSPVPSETPNNANRKMGRNAGRPSCPSSSLCRRESSRGQRSRWHSRYMARHSSCGRYIVHTYWCLEATPEGGSTAAETPQDRHTANIRRPYSFAVDEERHEQVFLEPGR